MNFPLYIYYEILIRLAEFIPNIGNYVSFKASGDHYIIKTTTGELSVSAELLAKQFEDPNLLSGITLAKLAGDFKFNA